MSESKAMKIAIVGSRTFIDYSKLKSFILSKISLNDDTTIISGGAQGADNLAEKFATEYGLLTIIHKAKWDKLGKSAGFIRNKKIIDDADIVFAFWDGQSRGTKHTIGLARQSQKPVHICRFK